ncbi:MAG: TolC family protein [Flavobacterium sp.]
MSSKNKYILGLFIVVSYNFACSQEQTWPLQKCIDLALQNNLELQIKQLEIKRTQKVKNSIVNQMLPAVNLYGDQSYNFGSTIDPSTNGRVSSNIQYDNFYINARMSLIDFNSLATLKKEKNDIAKAKVEKEIIENEYKLQLLESYYQALFTQELLKIQKEQFLNTEFNFDRVKKEVAIGSKPKSDLYDMQLSYSQEEKRVLETEQLFYMQKRQLFQLMNVVGVPIEDVLLVPYMGQKKSQSSFDGFINLKIKFAEFRYQENKDVLAIQRNSKLPILSGYYTFSTFYYRPLNSPSVGVDNFDTQLENNKNHQVGVQLSVPLFNGFRTQKKIASSKIELEKSRLAVEQEKQKLDKQIEIETQYHQNHEQLQAKLKEILNYAKASFTTTQAKFVSGKVDAFVLSSVKNLLLTSSFDVLKNSLQLEYVDLKINLLSNNQL